MLADVLRTQEINRALGTTLAPWDLDEIPEDWLAAVEIWTVEYPKALAWQKQIDASLARIRGQKVQ
jgi:hypothetical protein